MVNGWNCVARAFSAASGVNYSDLIDAIGHDGSEIIWPNHPEPDNRRGFHVFECTKALYERFETNFLVFPRFVTIESKGLAKDFTVQLPKFTCRYGVILGMLYDGRPHAEAQINWRLSHNREALDVFKEIDIWCPRIGE